MAIRDEERDPLTAVRPTIGEQVGRGARAYVDTATKARDAVVDTAKAAMGAGIRARDAVVDTAANVVRDVRSGFTAPEQARAAATAATQPVESASTRPRPVKFGAGRPTAPASSTAAQPIVSAPRTAVVPGNATAGPDASLSEARNPSPNTFVGSRTGVTTVQPAPPGSMTAAGSAAPAQLPAARPRAPVATSPAAAAATQGAARDRTTASNIPLAALDPRSMDNELLRRAENAGISRSGTSMSRAREQQFYLNQLAGRAAGAQAQAAESTRAAAGLNAADIDAASRAETTNAGEAGATTRALIDTSSREREGAAIRAVRPTVNLGDGRIALIGQDGTAQPVVGPDGQPVQGAPQRNSGAITPQDVFKAYSSQREAILNNGLLEPAQRDEMLAQLNADPLYAGVVGGPGGGAQAPAVPTEAQFIEAARAANPGASDAELRDYYRTNYGGS